MFRFIIGFFVYSGAALSSSRLCIVKVYSLPLNFLRLIYHFNSIAILADGNPLQFLIQNYLEIQSILCQTQTLDVVYVSVDDDWGKE